MIPSFIISFYILYTFLTIAIFATAMELCWKRISATQFTLYMAIANLGRATGAGFLGEIKEYLVSWEYVILTYTIAAIIMFVLLMGMNTEKHLLNVSLLENKMIK
jgi:PAT family beta-lactamase induction signal transducer AmpG